MPCGREMEEAVGLPANHTCKKTTLGSAGLRIGGERVIADGLLEGRVFWTGNVCRDLWCYYKNNHALLSLLMVHPLDAFSRLERLVVLICGMCWSVLSAGVALRESSKGRETYPWTILFGIIIYTFTTMMKKFAKCGAGIPIISMFGECAGHCGMFFGSILAAGMFALGYLIAQDVGTFDPQVFWRSFGISQAISWISGIVLGLFLFMVAWWKGRQEWKKKQEKNAAAYNSVSIYR
eukprot:g39667.t1